MTKMLPNGRKTGKGPVIVCPKHVFDTDEYRALSHRARTLLMFVHLTYNKMNNGSLHVTLSQPARYGFHSRDQMERARDELIAAGWLQVTVLPTAKKRPWLYALTWISIDANPGRGVAGTKVASDLWRAERAIDRETYGRTLPKRSARGFGRKTSAPPCGTRSQCGVPAHGKHEETGIPFIGTPQAIAA